MIIEARCNDCGKRIGYVSILGDTEMLRDTKYVKRLHTFILLLLFCVMSVGKGGLTWKGKCE